MLLTTALKINGKRVRIRGTNTIYEREYTGKTTANATESEAKALLATAIGTPLAVNDPHPDDPQAVITEIDVQADDANRRVFHITATWEYPQYGGTPPDPPLNRAPEIRWSSESDLRPIFLDYTSPQPKHIVNSAGERFDELPSREFGELALTYTRNESIATFDAATLREYMHAVNKYPFTIDGWVIPTGYAKIEFTEAPKITEGSTTYYRVAYFFRFKDGGWNNAPVLDVGYTRRPGGSLGLASPIVDADGMPVRKPYPLDGTGLPMPNPTDPPAELIFKFYEEKDFSVFAFT